MGKRKERSPEEQERRAKIRELLQLSGVSSMADIGTVKNDAQNSLQTLEK